MAEGKKSFVAYADWRDTFNELTDEDAGKLVKHIFAYVNDENPNTDNVVVKAVFAQIKNTLKRDLHKWEKQVEQRREAGKKSAEIRAAKSNDRSTTFNDRTRNSTDSVSDSVSVSDKEKETKFNLFWDKYPNKTGKKVCLDKFVKLPIEDINNILNTLDAYVAYKPFKDYTHPNPQTYLNQRRWEDEQFKSMPLLPELSRIVAHTAISVGGDTLQGLLNKGYTMQDIEEAAKGKGI